MIKLFETYKRWFNFIDGRSNEMIKNIYSYFMPYEIVYLIYQKFLYSSDKVEILMEWIPYSQITNMKQIAEGGFGIIYQATWLDGSLDEKGIRKHHQTVIVKKFEDSQDISKYFLNEVSIFNIYISLKTFLLNGY